MSTFQERKRCTLYDVTDVKKYAHLNPTYTDGKNLFFTTASKDELRSLVNELQKMNEGRLDCNLFQGEITKVPIKNDLEGTIEDDEFYKICKEKGSVAHQLPKEAAELQSEAHILSKLEGITISPSKPTKKRKYRKNKDRKVKVIAKRAAG
eukprot:NODE_22_length_38364_cov_0.248661.p20 type:complete len:151 gc:universal NODE_22_length_38364_cov_0.248661:18499-18047(-)